ncbi:DUF190 domain-containing protein [Desulfoplanes formicivorans]|uniref:Uncharacterized protein n=1 Tax=Desulfoplanes formicivorans TaxID=1592317 RepID=A0A194AKU6_9BACT|nr:DUF190 domain-containing protein [Desulfoplanes formicivorans]GAU09865.1 hypothetical protein DPF_2601 [Desulfoplanes formicivorans]
MEGYLVTFFTQQNRTHDDMPLGDWIVREAKQLGVRGATMTSGRTGFGHDGRFHSESYFDLEDTPLQVTMALTFDECDKLMARLRESQVRIFFTRSRIQFGFTCED